MFRNQDHHLRLNEQSPGLPPQMRLNRKPNSMSTSTKPAEYQSATDNGAWKTATSWTVLALVPYLFFVLANIYDMGGTHGVKYISYLVLVLLIPCARRPLNLRVHEEFGIVLLFLVWPACTLFIGLANGADFSGDFGAISQATPFLGFFVPLLVVPVLGAQRVLATLYYAFLTMGIAMVILTALMYQGLALGFVAQIPDYLSAMYSPYHGGIGEYRLYFEATLWLVPACIYFARTSRFPLAMLCLAGLIMSGSKAGALIALAFTLWILLNTKRHRILGLICVISAVAAGLYFLPLFLDIVRDAFLVMDSNNLMIRYGHAYSEIQVMLEKPWTIFIGNGAGATLYSSGTGEWVVRTETDHLDAIFHYGIVWFGSFTWLCFWTIRRLLRSVQDHHKAHGLALLSMYFASGTNPQLISPLFMLYLSACFLMARPLGKCRPAKTAVSSGVRSRQLNQAYSSVNCKLPSSGLGAEI